MLEKGSLKERVKRGEVDAGEARRALLDRRAGGTWVNDSILGWLERFRPKVEAAKPQNKRRRGRRRKGGRPAGRGDRLENG